MCDFGSSATTKSTSDQLAPGGKAPISGEATCCPDVAEFEKRTTRAQYYGYDDKTNKVAAGGKPYWKPAAKAKTAPSDRRTRDGAVWLSVAKGQTTKTTIDFTNNLGCIKNCTYEVNPASKALVVSTVIAADRATFEIKGTAKGDATVVVRCGGKDIGWIHVACWDLQSYRVGMVRCTQSVTSGTGAAAVTAAVLPSVAMNVANYQSFMDDAWRDAAVKVNLTALPDYEIPAATADMSAGNGFWDANGVMASPYFLSNASTAVYPTTDAIHTAVAAANPGYDKYILLIPEPGSRGSGSFINGFARGIGGSYCAFFNINSGTYSTAAHEFGHMVNLRHPNDSNGRAQYPPHLQMPSGGSNVIPDDTLNLMGYGNPRPNRKRLRYLQWKAVSGR